MQSSLLHSGPSLLPSRMRHCHPGHDLPPIEVTATRKQRLWDGMRAALVVDRLLEGAANDEEYAELLSVSAKEFGAWLRASPVSAQGSGIDDSTAGEAVGMCLGTAV